MKLAKVFSKLNLALIVIQFNLFRLGGGGGEEEKRFKKSVELSWISGRVGECKP